MRFCDEHGVALAPHGKTTMAPQLFADQLAAGAWGMTAATVGQAQVMARFGVRRILIANEVLDRRAIRWLAETDVDRYCLVDSVAGVEALEAAGAARPIKVLVEVGIAAAAPGCATTMRRSSARRGRALTPRRARGCRVLRGRRRHAARGRGAARPRGGARRRRRPRAVRRPRAPGRRQHLLRRRRRARRDREQRAGHVVLRSGCYLSHDDGMYEAASPLAARRRDDPLLPRSSCGPTSSPAPSPAARSPAPAAATRPTTPACRPSCAPTATASRSRSTPPSRSSTTSTRSCPRARGRLRPGDLLCLGISHPCGAFDRWRTLLEVDADYTVTRAIRTYF